MTTSMTISAAPARAGLAPGQIDRALLARAVTFALDSVRAGFTDRVGEGLDTYPGMVPGGLFWQQGSWIEHDADTAAYDRVRYYLEDEELAIQLERAGQRCGTGCCIAGWLDLAAGQSTPGNLYDSIALRARWLLIGQVDSGTRLDRAVDRLFVGSDDLVDVIYWADELLRLGGEPPLELDPTGTFR